jgi:hypothetical protein
MSVGIVEVVSLLLGLNGFGLQANPKAPTADQALEYAIPEADLVAHVDAVSFIPNNYKALTELIDQPAIKRSPELTKQVKDLVTQIEAPRGLVKGMTGIDLTTDVWDATLFAQVTRTGEHTGLIAVHGHFAPELLDKIGGMAGHAPVTVGAARWLDMGDNKALALTKDGVLLAGTTVLVKERIGDAWKTPPHVMGSGLGYAADVINQKPVFAVVMTLSPTARKQILTEHGQNFGTDLVKRHKAASFAIFHDGIGWTWVDSTKAGMESMAEVSDGLVDTLRAAQIAPRGFAKIVIGGLESYRGDKQVDELLKHKADIEQLAETFLGDGKFKVQLDKDPKAFKVTVRLSDRSLAYVLPLGGLLPMAVFGVLLRGEPAPPPPMEQKQIALPAKAVPAPPPAKKK